MTLKRAESDRYVMYYTMLKYLYTTKHILDSALETVFQSSSENSRAFQSISRHLGASRGISGYHRASRGISGHPQRTVFERLPRSLGSRLRGHLKASQSISGYLKAFRDTPKQPYLVCCLAARGGFSFPPLFVRLHLIS